MENLSRNGHFVDLDRKQAVEDVLLERNVSNDKLIGIALTELADVCDVIRVVSIDSIPNYRGKSIGSLVAIEGSIKRVRLIADHLKGEQRT